MSSAGAETGKHSVTEEVKNETKDVPDGDKKSESTEENNTNEKKDAVKDEVKDEKQDKNDKDDNEDKVENNKEAKKEEKTEPEKVNDNKNNDEKNKKDEKKVSDEEDEEEAEDESEEEYDEKVVIPKGTGTELGQIPRIDASISRFKNEDLKILQYVIYNVQGTSLPEIKKNIRKFKGYAFKRESDEYVKKLTSLEKFESKQLKMVCEMLDLDKKGNKEEISQRIMEFLVEPKDSGKAVSGGRPKRTAAVKANLGYSEEDSYSSEERAPRARRNAGRRSNLRDKSSSGSDEEFKPSEGSEDERPKRKRGAVGRRRGRKKEESEESENNSDEDFSDDEPKRKKKAPAKTPVKRSGRGRGRPPANAKNKKTPAKRGRSAKKETSDEEEDESDKKDGSSSEDEPLAKKTASGKSAPPTDEEIKSYIKELLDGANLQVVTMKTVCKDVYAHYPDFDLTHKKDYIKSTVKSLIST